MSATSTMSKLFWTPDVKLLRCLKAFASPLVFPTTPPSHFECNRPMAPSIVRLESREISLAQLQGFLFSFKSTFSLPWPMTFYSDDPSMFSQKASSKIIVTPPKQSLSTTLILVSYEFFLPTPEATQSIL